MKKRFKTKSKHYIIKFIFIIIIIYLSFSYTFRILFSKFNNTKMNPNKYLKYFLITGFNNQLNDYNFLNILNITKPENLLNYSLNTDLNLNNSTPVFNETDISETIEEITEETLTSPLVYIYNTHQTEEYKADYLAPYNINPTVQIGAYLLSEKLNDYGIPTIAETDSIKSILNSNGWNYSYSYKASRILLDHAKEEYPSLNFFIDFHRDSSVKDKTTLSWNNKNYAKVLFVVGKEHDNYQANLDVASELNNRIKKINTALSRGIYQKYGPGVNGIYNQDFHPNTILLEMGGQYNTIEEVSNTIDLISQTIADFIKEINNEKEK